MCRAHVHMCEPVLLVACCGQHMGTSAGLLRRTFMKHLACGGCEQLAKSHGCCLYLKLYLPGCLLTLYSYASQNVRII